jgi:hypothetical protein
MFTMCAALVQAAEPKVVSVCDVLRHPKLYDHKLVAIRGIEIATGEGVWLKALDCDNAFVTNGYVWPSTIWIDISDSDRAAAGVQGPELASSNKRIDEDLKKRGFDSKKDRLVITYVGLFEAYDDTAQEFHPDSRSTRANGFGHLNDAPAQIIVKDVKDAVIVKGAGLRTGKK